MTNVSGKYPKYLGVGMRVCEFGQNRPKNGLVLQRNDVEKMWILKSENWEGKDVEHGGF